MNTILEKLKKKYPALTEEPLMDELGAELSPEEDLSPSPDEAEDLEPSSEDLDMEMSSSEEDEEDMGFLSKAPAKRKLKR
jgi:hypothetical protein